jgi:mycoredoxin
MNHTANGNDSQVTMYTTTWCPDCWRAKRVMESMQVAFVEIDITHDQEAIELVEKLNRGNCSVPTILFPDGSVLTEPSTTQLVAKLNGTN